MKYFEKMFASKKARWAACIILVIILAGLIFHAGVVVGSHRGQFRGGEFGNPGMRNGFRPPFFPEGFEMPHGFIQDGHGAVGTITALSLPTFQMQTREGINQTIFVSTSTIIRSGDAQNSTTLATGENVIVLGTPDSQNRIDAKIIRILPSVPPLP